MNDSTENTGSVTGATSATRRPRSLDELLDREERLAARGIAEEAQLLGGDLRDALNLPLHLRRRPFGTTAALGAIGALAFLGVRRMRSAAKNRRGRKRGRGLVSTLLRSLVGTAVTGLVTERLGVPRRRRKGRGIASPPPWDFSARKMRNGS